jgi:glycosyltransferase involved in cell wall biosynthesis
MKILFQTRYNLNQLGGGDKIQLLKTKEALEKRGHTVTVATGFVADLRPYDLVHLFNMQLHPHSLLIYANRAKRADKPVALSTIYWNPSQWFEHEPPQSQKPPFLQRLYPFKGVPIWRFAAELTREPIIWRWMGTFLRQRGGGQASDLIKRALIARVDIILPNGESEAEMVQHDFGTAKLSLFVPNGASDDYKNSDAKVFEKQYGLKDFVLSVGRIESRKHAVALAKAVTALGLPFVMIGNDTVEPAYAAAVKAAAPDALFIPEMPQEALGAAYKAAKVHALASWFETPGLSSLEAALCGCNIVSTELGTTKEYFGDLAWYCTPLDDASIKQAIQKAYAVPKTDKLRQHILDNFSWSKVAEATEKGYQQIVNAS